MPFFIPFQVLVFLEKLGHFVAEFHEVHHLPAAAPLPLHPHLRPVGDAAVRRYLQFPGGHAFIQLQFILHCHAHCLSSKEPIE